MISQKWQAILAAKARLGLPDQASMKEIKAAYRKCCREHHPDLAHGVKASSGMQEINAAYAVLLDYGATCRFSLVPPTAASECQDPEDWWLNRFGEDPLWGRKKEK